jgi:hypothetical protein
LKNVPGITRTFLIISIRHESVYPVAYSFSGDLEFLVGEGGGPVSCDRCNPATGNGNSLCHRAGDFTKYITGFCELFSYLAVYSVGKALFAHISTRGRILGRNLDKSLRVCLLAIQSHLYSFALIYSKSRNLLQFLLCVTVSKGERRKT